MAIADGNDLGSTSSGTSATTIVLTTTAAAAAGSVIAVWASGAGMTVTNVQDSASNTYEEHREHTNGNSTISVWSAYGALGSGGTITVTFSGSAITRFVAAHSFTGWAGKAHDTANSATQFNATAWSSNAAVPSTADPLVLGGCMGFGATGTSTPGGSFSEAADMLVSAEGCFTATYRMPASSSSLTASGTWTVASGADQSSIIAILKEQAPLDIVLPDADITTTGWTSTPLYSKINDTSDATVITGALS